MDQFMWIFVGIIVLALTFSIINTMLMAVLERTHELGMLMAVGMNKARVFGMIMLETIFLSMVGVPIGLIAAWGSITWLSGVGRGLDLSAFSEGLSEFGMSSVIQPQLDSHFYWQVMLLVAIASILAAVYPALRALKLKPVEAIRSH
ncbi:MAG: FtsX-like permease family protein, partial [Bacteroidota bacterium]